MKHIEVLTLKKKRRKYIKNINYVIYIRRKEKVKKTLQKSQKYIFKKKQIKSSA